MAVLFRATHHSQFLEMELNRQGIAYDYRGGLRFFERAHIKDLAAYLKLLNNLRDEVSWLRILNLQAGIGAVTAARIITEINLVGKKNFCELADVDLTTKLNEAAGQGWKNLRQTMAALAALPDTNKVATVIQTIIDSGYREYLQGAVS
jgi:DNA helicase-2/ATP-dependent DNA helicase PcrA